MMSYEMVQQHPNDLHSSDMYAAPGSAQPAAQLAAPAGSSRPAVTWPQMLQQCHRHIDQGMLRTPAMRHNGSTHPHTNVHNTTSHHSRSIQWHAYHLKIMQWHIDQRFRAQCLTTRPQRSSTR